MKIMITGASGKVGRCLVDKYLRDKAELILIGRNRAELSALFPGTPTGTFDEIATLGAGCDALLHLAVLNNDAADATKQSFIDVNVALTETVINAARQANIARLILTSSFHALDDSDTSPYAVSKRMMCEKFEGQKDVELLYLPFVYDEDMDTRLSGLSRLPAPLRSLALQAAWALKPVVFCERLAQHILAPAASGRTRIYLVEPQSQNYVYTGARLLLDWAFTALMIIGFWWLLIGLWVAVKATSEGPGLFRQTRLGRQQKPFTCYKFRTMAVGAPQKGTHEVCPSYLTKTGRFLRKTKADELPQILNILRNEISLIGPRPGLPSQEALRETRERHGIFAIKPGISGLSQINDVDMSDPEKLARMDAEYMARQSLILDLKIAIATVTGRGFADRTRSLEHSPEKQESGA